MGVANNVTGGFIQKACMHCLLYGFVLCMESFGGTDEVAEKKDAAPQIVPESRRIEEKDLLFFIMFNSVVVFPGACVCRKWSWWSGMLLH